jgi:hypothetical protein
MKSWPKFALFTIAVAFGSGAAWAASDRTFVASYGADANRSAGCGPATPCRTLDAALAVTNAGGQVVVLDSGAYGPAPIRITHSVSITAADGVYAEVAVPPGANGVEISGSGVAVALKGLTISDVAGNDGLRMTSGASLLIEGCTIIGNANAATSGIYTNGPITVRIVDSTVRDGYDGISLVNGAVATIKGVRLLNNSNIGLNVQGESAGIPTTVAVADTLAAGGAIGLYAESVVRGATAQVSIDRSVVSGNGIGIESSNDLPGSEAVGTVSVGVSNSLISDNRYGLRAMGASATMYLNASTISNSATCAISTATPDVIYTYGNNVIRNSGNCGSSMTAVALQ